jgi:hypothetical protein
MSLQFLKNLNGSNSGHFAKLLSSLESKENLYLSWYPSSGEDFRNVVILNDLFMGSKISGNKQWKQPDLFIYTDFNTTQFTDLFPEEIASEFTKPMTEMESILSEYSDLGGWNIFYDDKTGVRIKRFEWLPELNAMFDKQLMHSGEFGLSNKKVAYMLLDIWTKEFGELEAHLIYCNVGNEWFANKLITENAKISHLTKVKYGSNFGGAIASGNYLKNILTKLGTQYYICDSLNTVRSGDEAAQRLYPALRKDDSEYELNQLFVIPENYWNNNNVTVFEVDLISGEIEQSFYHKWAQDASAREHESLCGGNVISPNEKYFIDKYAKNNCLDIGCGTGNRTFPEFERKGINYVGIEQFKHLKEFSKFSSKILLKDIASDSFQIDEVGNQKFDIAFYFGGVVNGFVSKNVRSTAWKNIEQVAQKQANYILFDTLSHFDWFHDESHEFGKVLQLNPMFPPQYFYSLKELKNLFAKHYLEIVEEKEEVLMGTIRRTHYVLKCTI